MANTKQAKSIQTSYRKALQSEAGRDVLEDLNVFCHGTKTTAGRSESIERLEGRREVYLRIMTMLKIDINDVFEEYIEDF